MRTLPKNCSKTVFNDFIIETKVVEPTGQQTEIVSYMVKSWLPSVTDVVCGLSVCVPAYKPSRFFLYGNMQISSLKPAFLFHSVFGFLTFHQLYCSFFLDLPLNLEYFYPIDSEKWSVQGQKTVQQVSLFATAGLTLFATQILITTATLYV